MKQCIAIIAGLVLCAGQSMADPASECEGSNQIEIGECVADTLERVSGVVQMYLQFALTSAQELDEVTQRKDTEPALLAGQAAWEAFRDAHCDYVGATFGGGSGTGIAIASCKIELGRARAGQLSQYTQ